MCPFRRTFVFNHWIVWEGSFFKVACSFGKTGLLLFKQKVSKSHSIFKYPVPVLMGRIALLVFTLFHCSYFTGDSPCLWFFFLLRKCELLLLSYFHVYCLALSPASLEIKYQSVHCKACPFTHSSCSVLKYWEYIKENNTHFPSMSLTIRTNTLLDWKSCLCVTGWWNITIHKKLWWYNKHPPFCLWNVQAHEVLYPAAMC